MLITSSRAQSTNQPSNTLATQAASLSPMSMMQTSDLSSLSIGMASTNTNVSTSSVVTIASELEASATPTESAILVTTSGSDLITISHGPKADLVGCPAWDGATWTPFSSDNETYKWDQNLPMSFDIFCQANIPAGQGENPAITDMWHLQTDTLQSCIDHCASYNGEYHDLTTYDMCSGVTWDVDNYCWMKRGFRNLGTSNYPLIFGPSGYASAIIIEPLNRANYKNDPAEFNSSWPNATHV